MLCEDDELFPLSTHIPATFLPCVVHNKIQWCPSYKMACLPFAIKVCYFLLSQLTLRRVKHEKYQGKKIFFYWLAGIASKVPAILT